MPTTAQRERALRIQYCGHAQTFFAHLRQCGSKRCVSAHLRQLRAGVSSSTGLGQKFGRDFYECEARYLVAHEWALDVDDILDRRTKHGLHMSGPERQVFVTWFSNAWPKAG